jgi:hypothetical protein
MCIEPPLAAYPPCQEQQLRINTIIRTTLGATVQPTWDVLPSLELALTEHYAAELRISRLEAFAAMNLKSRGEPRKAKKRDDIQGLRTVAILGVLLFHIWPDCFVRGFLGVDM